MTEIIKLNGITFWVVLFEEMIVTTADLSVIRMEKTEHVDCWRPLCETGFLSRQKGAASEKNLNKVRADELEVNAISRLVWILINDERVRVIVG